VHARTGVLLDPYFSAPKLAWLRRALTTEGVVGTTDAWLLQQLTGRSVTDVSTASRSGLVALGTMDWDAKLLDVFELTDEAMPAIVACDAVIGTTQAFGRGTEIPVAGAMVDQQAALLGQGCIAPGDAKCTFGTGAFLLAHIGDRAVVSSHGLTTSAAWSLRGRVDLCLDGQVFAAGSALRWLRTIGVLPDGAQPDDIAAADSGGVVFVPGLAGLGSPWWRSGAAGAFVGMDLASDRGVLVAAVLDGIAAHTAVLYDGIVRDAGLQRGVLRVDGGVTASATLMQAVADLCQVEVQVAGDADATAHGVAAAARLARDPSLTVADALPARTTPATFEPRIDAARAAERLAEWCTVVERVIGGSS
jgi:glycerol kinase